MGDLQTVIILPGILTSDENTDEVAEFAIAQATSVRALTASTSATSVPRVRVANISHESDIRVTGQNIR